MSSLSLQVFVKGVDKDDIVLMAARASRLENQDTIDAAIVTMLADPKQVLLKARAGITEIHFLPFNPTDKRTALTYIDKAGTMHRVSKCAPEQEVPERKKDSSGGPWEFIALLPLFDPPCHDSAETIRRALELGVGDILHYGKSMENVMRACCKGIKTGKILIHRDGDNGKQLIYEKLPKDISERHVLLLDLVLGTGSVYAGVDFCKKLCGVSIVRRRPNIMYATCLCARFQDDPREPHLLAVKRIFKYLKGTMNLGLWYHRDSAFKLIGYPDADFAGCKTDRKSTSGSCQFLGGRLVSCVFDDGGANGSPSLVFEFDNTTRIVTPQAVRDALQLPTYTSHSSLVCDIEMRRFFTEISYDKDLNNIGQLKRNGLRKEWNFFFDCITKVFNNKYLNFDALPIMTQQIGYSLIDGSRYDYGRVVLSFIGDMINADRNIVYQSAKLQEITIGNPHVAHLSTTSQTLKQSQTEATSSVSQKTLVVKRKKDLIKRATNPTVAKTKDEASQVPHSSKPSEIVKRKLVLAGLESDSDEDNATLSSRFPNLSSDSSPKLVIPSTERDTTADTNANLIPNRRRLVKAYYNQHLLKLKQEIAEETQSASNLNSDIQSTGEAVELSETPVMQYHKRKRGTASSDPIPQEPAPQSGVADIEAQEPLIEIAQESIFAIVEKSTQEPGCQSHPATPYSPATQEPLHQSYNTSLTPAVVTLIIDTEGRVHPSQLTTDILSVPQLNVRTESASSDSQDAQSTKGTDAKQQSVESQENSDVPKAISLPASLRTELLEVNLEAPIHLSTILEGVELTAEGVEASEATGSYTAPVSHLIRHAEAGDKFQKLVQSIIEASKTRLEANQAQMSDQLTELKLTSTDDENPDGGNKGEQKESKRRRGEVLVGVSGSSKAITRF
ncbi:hypothetical protein AgCh_012805 [Apium graveolens]